MPFRTLAYGLRWAGNQPLCGFEQDTDAASSPDISVCFEPGRAPERTLQQRGKHLWRAADGMRYLGPEGLALDSFGGDRLLLYGVPAHSDAPLAFYGTMAALLLAMRGLLPLHGSAVEWQGKAVLICGASGSGKSSLAAALLSRGARLLSDDLTVLHPRPSEMRIYPGRTGLRLFPAVAKALGHALPGLSDPHRGADKWTLQAPRARAAESFALQTVLLAGAAGGQRPALSTQLYRPRALAELPGGRRRQLQLAFAERALRFLPIEPGRIDGNPDLQRTADEVVRLLETG